MFTRTVHVSVLLDVNSGVLHHSGNHPDPKKSPTRFRGALIIGSMVVVMLGIVGVLSYVTQAQTVTAYPEVCLGGWEGSARASGKHERGAGESFLKEHAALLPANTAAEIFCSSFTASIPDDTIPTRLTLELALSTNEHIDYTDGGNETLSPDAGAGEEEPTAPQELLDQNPEPASLEGETTESVDSSAGTTSTQNEESTPPESVPEPLPEASRWFERFILVAHAEELTEETAVIVDEPSPEVSEPVPDISTTDLLPENEPEPAVLPAEVEETKSAPEVLFETGAVVPLPLIEALASTSDEIPVANDPMVENSEMLESPVVDASLPGVEPVLEVLVTFDGVTWQTLGTLSEEGLRDARFEVVVPDDVNWDTIGNLQVLVRPIITTISRKPILLESMALVIEYEPLGGDVAPLAAQLTSDDAFGLGNRFVLDLKASQEYALVKTQTVEGVVELYTVRLDGARPPLRVANSEWIAPESPLGLFKGFAFWVSPEGEVYGFSLARSRYISTSFVGQEADNVEAYRPERLSFGVTVRGSEFAFSDLELGEVTSEDDAELKMKFLTQVFDSAIPASRDDLVNLHLIPAPEEETPSAP